MGYGYFNSTDNEKAFNAVSENRNRIFQENLNIENNYINEKIYELKKRTSNSEIINHLDRLINIPVRSSEDLQEKIYWFNDGNLRSREEVLEKESRERMEFYSTHSEIYSSECDKRNRRYGIISFIIGFCFTMVCCSSEFGGLSDSLTWVILTLPAIWVGLLFVIIAEIISHKKNIKKADELGISNDKVRKEKTSLHIYEGGGLFSAFKIFGSLQDNIKHINDPDSWE